MDAGNCRPPLETIRRPSEIGSKATVRETGEGNSFPDRRQSYFLRQRVETGSVFNSAFC